IGAGAAGLCALKHILSKKGFVPIIWEHSSEVGGTWIYTSNIGTDKHGFPIHSSMYNSLKTNLPKEIMAFPDFPFKEGEKSFIHHTEVLQYLNDYTDHFGLRHLINFEHHVDWVEPVERESGPPGWKVSVRNLVEKKSSEEECDALIICNGHYSTPKYPDIVNMDSFSGKKMHSHSYRVQDPFSNMTVAGVGSISLWNGYIRWNWPRWQKRCICATTFRCPSHPSSQPTSVRRKASKRRAPEASCCTTGLSSRRTPLFSAQATNTHFPLPERACEVRVDENRVRPLYKQPRPLEIPFNGDRRNSVPDLSVSHLRYAG
ncbi:UNVERIFIED_CONTAM: hypothetical protein GTU68_047673, partial [Idotea baltica]|nr:hypothetical protein [Idotea baltica]